MALTGGIASGKSLVADQLAELGAVIIDADVLAREVVEPGQPALEEIRETFGDEVFGADGALDRSALGRLVFSDDAARQKLNQITHPRVRERARELEAQAPQGSVVVHVIPLLVEIGQAPDFPFVAVVDVPEELQLERLMARNGLSEEDAKARIASQVSRAERLAVADWVIDNSGTQPETAAQVEALWAEIGEGHPAVHTN